MTLKQKTFTAVRWTTASAVAKAILQLAQTAVLARLLDPGDYGLMAMAGVVLGFAGLFSDLGLNSAYLQKQNVSVQERSSLFWLNLGMSSVLALLVIILSPFLAWLLGNERITPILMLCSIVFIFGALGQQIRMAAEKELNFRPVVFLEVSAILIGFIVAATAAINGAGVYSLVYGSIVSTAVGSLLAWILIANGWRPQLRFSLADVKPYIGFGGAVVGNNVINYVNMSVDLMLGGRLLGATALGLFSVPRNLVLQIQFMVNPIISRVGFPLIAQIQHDVPRVRAIYLKTMRMTVSCNAPIYIGLAFYAPEIVRVILGSNWSSSAELLRILSIWGLLRSVGNPVGSLLYGMGRADLSLNWNLALLFITLPVLWLGSILYGAKGMSISMGVLMGVLLVPGWYFLIWPLCGLPLARYLLAIVQPIVIALVSVLLSYVFARCFEAPLMRLSVGIAISVTAYIATSYLFNKELWETVDQLILGKNASRKVVSAS